MATEAKKPEIPTVAPPRTRAEIEAALAEKRVLATLATTLAATPPKEPAGQAPAEVLASERVTTRYAEPERPAAPPAAPVDVEKLSQAKQTKEQLIAAKVVELRRKEVELSEQEQNAKDLIAQMKAERQALLLSKEALERDVIDLQREAAAADARRLSAQAAKDQAARGESANIPLEQWRASWATAILPLTGRVVAGLGRLRLLYKEKASTLETVATLRSQPGLDNELRSEFIAVSTEAGKILGDLHEAIRVHERVLVHAEEFRPDPRTPDGRSAVNGIRHELESVTGIVTGRLVDIVNPRVLPPSNGVEGNTPSSVDLAERVAAVLTQYADVQRRINRVARPAVVITLGPKPERPRHEVLAEQRGPAPVQVKAEGVPE
jgi:hypothetical protein